MDFVGELSVPIFLKFFVSIKMTLKVKPKPLQTIRNRLSKLL